MSLEAAFKYGLSLNKRSVTLKRLAVGVTPEVSVTVPMTPSNFAPQYSSIEETTITGHEYIVSRDVLVAASFPMPPKRGDTILDTVSNSFEKTIDSVREVNDLGGTIMGYRIRTA